MPPYRTRSIAKAALILLAVTSLSAQAFERSDGEQVTCEIDYEGVRAAVREEYVGNGPVGTTHPALGGSAAVVRRQRDGTAHMVFDRFVMARIASRSRLAADLVFYHECAHVQLQTDDEIEANCEAVRQMRAIGYLDAEGYAALTTWHENMGRVAPRYGGNGRVFWQRTEACLARHAAPDSAGAAATGVAGDPSK